MTKESGAKVPIKDKDQQKNEQQSHHFKWRKKRKAQEEIMVEVGIQDSPWGWLVVTCASLSMFMVDGVVFTFGTQIENMVRYWEQPKSTVALINSITYSTYLMLAPVSSIPVNHFGFRKCSAVASLVVALSLYASTYANKLVWMYVLYGICVGAGASVLNLTANLVVGFYFERYRAIAGSIASCGTSCGIMVFAWVNNRLIDNIGWQLLTELHAGLVGLTYFSALSYKPLKTVLISAQHAALLRATASTPALELIPPPRKMRTRMADKFMRLFRILFDTSLLKRSSFRLFCFTGFFAYLGLVVPSVYVQSSNIANGMDRCLARYLVSTMGLFSTIGRLVSGLAGQKCSPVVTVVTTQVIAGLCACFSHLTFDPYYQFGWVALFGFSLAATTSLKTTVIAHLYGVRKLTSAFGLIMMFQGFGGLFSTPLAGYLIDQFGYPIGFIWAGAALIVSALLLIPVSSKAKKEYDKKLAHMRESGRGRLGSSALSIASTSDSEASEPEVRSGVPATISALELKK